MHKSPDRTFISPDSAEYYEDDASDPLDSSTLTRLLHRYRKEPENRDDILILAKRGFAYALSRYERSDVAPVMREIILSSPEIREWTEKWVKASWGRFSAPDINRPEDTRTAEQIADTERSIAQMRAEPFTDTQIVNDFMHEMETAAVPQDIFKIFYNKWVAARESTREKLNSELEAYYESYIDKLSSREDLPFTISPELIEKVRSRIAELHVAIFDPLDVHRETIYAEYSAPKTVRVSERELKKTPEERQHTYSHELNHAVLSGRSAIKHQTQSGSIIATHKIGLLILQNKVTARGDRTQAQGFKIRWLNEAVTEWVASLLDGVKPDTYLKEIAVFKGLLEIGLDPQVIFDAYTEDYVPGQKGYPALKKLLQEIGSLKGENWMSEREEIFNSENKSENK